MNAKLIILFLLAIGYIVHRSWAIQIFPEQTSDEESTKSQIQRFKDDDNFVTSSNSREVIEEPPDHEIPYSEHENPEEVSTKPKYVAPGEWVKPPKEKNIPLDFVPTKLYAQVRGTHTVKHAPREEAIKDAETDEEKLNALRLREVVKNSKINTIYTEEGYEDSAYDHAGHIRDADFHEGFARKLRDRLKQKHEKDKDNLEELADYEDDYGDYDEKDETNLKDNYLKSYANPKSIVRNEIEVLVEDVEKDAEKAEEASDINLFDSKKVKEPKNPEKKSGYYSQENESQDTRIIEDNNYNVNSNDRVKYETTTYNPVQETISDRSFQSSNDHYDKENPTTISYGQVLWDFLKIKNDEPIVSVEKEATTSSPVLYQPTSISTMTLTVPGSYFFSTQQETTTPLSVFPAFQTYHPRGLDSDLVNAGLITSISQNNDQVWPLQAGPINYISRMDNPTISLTSSSNSNPEESWKPLIQSTLNYSILNNAKNKNDQETTILPEKDEANNSENEEIQDDSIDYSDDPLLNPLVEDTSMKLDQKKKYRVLVRHKPRKSTRTPKSHRSQEDRVKNVPRDTTDYDKFINDQRAKYLKVLNYVTNQDRAKESNNFAVARAPVDSRTKEVRYFDFRAEDRPAGVDQPSVPIESETIMREPIDKKLPRNRPISSVDGFLGTSSLPIYKIDPFPLLDLSPPPPPSSTYNRNKYRPLSLTYGNNRHYRNIEPILKYAPVIVDLTRKSRERRKRSLEYVKGDRNNGTTNRETRKRDYDKSINLTKDGRRNSRLAEESNDGDIRESDYADRRYEKDFQRARRSKRTREKLLNDSPIISGRVIDKEIEERFNKGKDGEKSEDVKNVDVEVEVPDFDYVEIADEKEENQPTTTEITLDLKKYPFYVNERIEDLSGLKYAIDPKKVPRKTATGMEFYDSRDKYKDCEEIEENLDEVLPEEEKPSTDRGPNENGPRLRGLGEKLDCFKAKYFGENPFDNPLFIEKNVGDPNLPKELNPKKLSKRILVLPAASDDFIFQKLSRKPEEQNFSSRRSERKYNNDQLEKNKRLSRPYGTRNSKGHQRTPKKQQRKERVASLLNLSTEPYHKQVYEDVMNHITGSNDLYRVYGITTIKPVPQVQVAASTTNLDTLNGNLNELINTTTLINIGNYDNNTEIGGLLPPKDPNDFVRQSNPGSKRIIRINKRRLPRYYVPRTIARYHAIKIQKRSIERPKTRRVSKPDDLVAEESDIRSVTVRSRRRKLSSRNLTSSTEKSITEDPENEPSSKIIYTIRDRIRYSKPKDEVTNVGKFVATASTFDEDTRRKEPRYNNIRRTPSGFDSSTVPTILSTIWSDKSIIKESTTPMSVPNKRLQYATLSRDRSRKNLDEDSTKENNKYEVHENIDDATVTTPVPIVSTSSEYSDVKEYLNSDPPGYEEAFFEETTEFPIVEETRSKKPNEDLKEISKESEENSNESTERSYESKEEISERKEDERDEEDEEETNDSSEESKESKESKEEDRTFFHYSSRPYSPPENYEDEKYSDLGKRINKPAFYHPPFSMLGYERSSLKESSEEDVQDEDEEGSAENKKTTRFALLPWSAEKEGHEKSFGETKYYSRPFWSYEYPWEKRERLARGEREKGRERKGRSGRKSYGGFGDFHSKDSDEDVSSSKHTGSRVYPWDLYDVPSRKNGKSRRERYFDADGSGSEHKPVKYSSKYNSSLLGSISSLNNSNRFAIDPERIRKERNQLGSAKETNKSSNIRRIVSGTLVPEVITQSPKKGTGRKGKTDERNSIEVTSVATVEQKKRKNVMRKETQHEEANSTTQSSTTTSTDNTNKSNITDRSTDRSRRRRILKKYSASNDVDKNNPTERKEQVKRRRGKIRSTTIAPSTTTTTIASSTKSSRRRPQTRPQEFDDKFLTSKTSVPTPSTTTVEHRSRVSKESFVSRTTYPDNENSTTRIENEPETLETKYHNKNDEIDRNRGNITSENVERISVMTKETPDHVYQTKKIDKDGVKEMFISIMPNKAGNVSELESDSSEFNDEEHRWKIPRVEFEDLSDIPSTESYLIGNFLEQSTGTYSSHDREFADENTKLNVEEETDEKEDKTEIKSTIKFIHHPERRLYYYVERRR